MSWMVVLLLINIGLPCAADDENEAAQSFALGKRLYDQGNYLEARKAFQTAYAHSQEFDVLFESSRKTAEGLATAIEVIDKLSFDEVKNAIKSTLDKNPAIYGSTVAFDPKATRLGMYAPYYYRSKEGLKFLSLAAGDYDYE